MSLFSPQVEGEGGGLAFPSRLSLSRGEDAALGSSIVKSVGWVELEKPPPPSPSPLPPTNHLVNPPPVAGYKKTNGFPLNHQSGPARGEAKMKAFIFVSNPGFHSVIF